MNYTTEIAPEVRLTQNGSQIAYYANNASSEIAPTVLIPGIGGTIHSLHLLAQALHDRGHTVLNIDTTSASGQFGRPATMYGFTQLCMEAVDEQLGQRPVNMVTHSWSGALGQEAAVNYPDRIQHLGLMATLPGGIPVHPASMRTMMHMMNPDRSPDRLEQIAGELYGGDIRENPDLIKSLNIAHEVDSMAYMRQHTALVMCAFSGLIFRLGRIQAETLVIGGTDDPITPLQNSEEIHRRISGSDLQIMEGGGHMFPVTRAEDTAARLNAFLKATST